LFTPLQALHVKGSAGDPLPKVWETLEAQFLRGQLALVCAGPGVGKSAMVLTYAIKAKVPTLYLSADSDAFTQLSRTLSIITGWDMGKTSRMVRENQLGETETELSELPIRFKFNASPDMKQINTSLLAFEELYDDFPALVVIDNITNVRTGSLENDDDPFSGLESLMDYLHDQARKTQSCIIGLHHVTGKYNDADSCIPLSGVKGQIARVPEMVLTLHKVPEPFGPSALNVSTVKNRAGRADPSGLEYISLDFTPETMTIKDRV
jgi:RecA-family ATPase